MQLLKYREKINTECTLLSNPPPILSIKAIKIDGTPKGLKHKVGCRHLKSCDYFRQKKENFYFIEISDFYQQLLNLKKTKKHEEAVKEIKNEVHSKLSETLLIYQQLQNYFKFNEKKALLKKKTFLVTCQERKSDSLVFAKLQREFEKKYQPTFFTTIKFIPYKELENILGYKKKSTTQ